MSATGAGEDPARPTAANSEAIPASMADDAAEFGQEIHFDMRMAFP